MPFDKLRKKFQNDENIPLGSQIAFFQAENNNENEGVHFDQTKNTAGFFPQILTEFLIIKKIHDVTLRTRQKVFPQKTAKNQKQMKFGKCFNKTDSNDFLKESSISRILQKKQRLPFKLSKLLKKSQNAKKAKGVRLSPAYFCKQTFLRFTQRLEPSYYCF